MNTSLTRPFARAALIAAVLCSFAVPGHAGPPLKGEVMEVRDAAPYTYLRLKTSAGETWAAVMAVPVKKGAQVTVVNTLEMQNFESKALNRRFDKVVFGTVADPNAPAPSAPPATTAQASPHGTGGMMAAPKATASTVGKVPKATGGDARTVEEVVSGKSALKDKSVSVRAQVVRVNNGIMGKNWIHVQDGSGKPAAGTHDVLVTSKDTVAVGDIVTVKGTVRTDVKVGPGYDYAVLIEDASVRK